jgi:uncharacterized membrane protein YtjA (UPF0391 family)
VEIPWQLVLPDGPIGSKEIVMELLLYVGIVLLIIALVAYLLGARGVAGMTAGLGKTFLIVGLVLGLILIVLSRL